MVIASRDRAMVARFQEQHPKLTSLPAWIRSASRAKEFVLAGVLIFAWTGAAWLIEPFAGYQSVALLNLLLVVLLGLARLRAIQRRSHSPADEPFFTPDSLPSILLTMQSLSRETKLSSRPPSTHCLKFSRSTLAGSFPTSNYCVKFGVPMRQSSRSTCAST